MLKNASKLMCGGLPLRHFRTELRTPGVADFTPETAARVLSRSSFDPMMRTSPSATSTRWARARRYTDEHRIQYVTYNSLIYIIIWPAYLRTFRFACWPA